MPLRQDQEEQRKLDKLLDWASENGAFIENIKLQATGGKRLALAAVDIPTQTPVLTVPESLCISESVASLDAFVAAFTKKLHENPGKTGFDTQAAVGPLALGALQVALFVALERKNSFSFYKPYLDALPPHFPTIPICFSDPQLQLLKGTSLYQMTLKRREFLFSVYEIAKESLDSFGKQLEWLDFVWGFCVVTSRAFPRLSRLRNVSCDSGNEFAVQDFEVCLYPVLDMIDHERGFLVEWKTIDSKTSLLINKETKKGQELKNNYGPKGNENLFANYGFVLDPNPEDYFRLPIGATGIQTRVSEFIESEGIKLEHLISRHGPPDDLIRLLSLLIMSSHEFEKYSANQLEPFDRVRLKVASLARLVDLLSPKYQELKKEWSRPNTIDDVTRMIQVYRDGQEQVLKSTFDWIKLEMERECGTTIKILHASKHVMFGQGSVLDEELVEAFGPETCISLVFASKRPEIGEFVAESNDLEQIQELKEIYLELEDYISNEHRIGADAFVNAALQVQEKLIYLSPQVLSLLGFPQETEDIPILLIQSK